MSRKSMVEIMATLAAAYPNAKLEQATIEVYCRALHDIPADVLQAAAMMCITRNKFLPTIAELRTEAVELLAPKHPAPEDAWNAVLDQVAAAHYDGKPTFADPVVNQVVRGMGWRTICLSDENNVSVVRGQFLRLYQSAVERERRDAMLLPEVRHFAAQLQETGRIPQLKAGEDE